MKITHFLSLNTIHLFTQKISKDEALSTLTSLLFPDGGPAREQAIAAVLERETVAATGVGDGVAVPHARIDASELKAAFGLLHHPINFDANDGAPVKMILLALFPQTQPTLQLRFLARTSRVFHNPELRNRLSACTTARDIHTAFTEYEDIHYG